jgi:uncharacterized protein YggE
MKQTIILISLMTLALPYSALAQVPEPIPSLVVTGNASLKIAPDEATVRLGVTRQGPTAQAAQEQANRTGQDILTAMQKLKIPAERVQTSRITLNPIYTERRLGSNEPPRIIAYSATSSVTVLLEDLTMIGQVIDAALTASANVVEGVQFNIRNDATVRERALRDAVGEARRKAETMADALGVRLVNVQEVSEGGVSIVPRFASAEAFEVRAAATPTPVSPGQLDVNASVTLRYRIAPK